MNDNNNDIVEVEYTEEDKKQLHRRIFKMVSVAGITLIVLIVATYAWFIGTTSANVEPFSVQIETLEGLQISFNGTNFRDSAEINSTNYNDMGIVNNQWVVPYDPTSDNRSSSGLKPVSTSGHFTTTEENDEPLDDGHLDIYQNSSVTAITGGYRLRTTRVPNRVADQDSGFNETTTSPESQDYITFDLFLKNNTNTQGTSASSSYDKEEAEAVYLTTNSKVELVRKGGEGTPSSTYGPSPDAITKPNWLENSVRIGFYQIAYAPLGTEQADLQAMGCVDDDTNNTVGVCEDSGDRANRTYSWNIWEPNDLRHMGKALTKYDDLCLKRTEEEVYDTTTPCKDITGGASNIIDGNYYNTYAVNKEINVNTVNIYDGFNGYTATIGDNNFLYNTGTDSSASPPTKGTLRSSENIISGSVDNGTIFRETNREPLIRIAPNSITKIRVYIWLEGQDIDNIEYDANDQYNLRFTFGFTKDMYELPIQSPSPATSSPSASEPEEP